MNMRKGHEATAKRSRGTVGNFICGSVAAVRPPPVHPNTAVPRATAAESFRRSRLVSLIMAVLFVMVYVSEQAEIIDMQK
jgi:hypothetical protein